ncbi:MAG TPA: hypothetical protein VLE49_17005 [Anaerolineales bacterium]|nr:hypothetical protein [Anaerolineales bacterium]
MDVVPDYTRYDDEELISLVAQLQEEALALNQPVAALSQPG